MRWILIAPLAGAALFAQTPAPEPEKSQAVEVKPEAAAPPPDEQQAKSKRDEERVRRLQSLAERLSAKRGAVNVVTNGKIALAPGQPCAIPLKNVLPEAAATADEKMIVPVPKSPPRFPAREVSPPAPSCDDVKR
jgi:hypothetical protein